MSQRNEPEKYSVRSSLATRRRLRYIVCAACVLMFGILGAAVGLDDEVLWYQPIRRSSSSEPLGPIIQGRDGFFYGYGRNEYGIGTIFRTDISGNYTIIETLSNHTITGMVEGGDGKFYGTAINGTGGIVFRLSLDDSPIETLHSFDRSTDGRPLRGLVRGEEWCFYGLLLREAGGPPEEIFRIDTNGAFALLEKPFWYTSSAGQLYAGPDGTVIGCNGFSIFKIVPAVDAFVQLYEFPDQDPYPHNTTYVPASLSFGIDGTIFGIARNYFYRERIFSLDTGGNFIWSTYPMYTGNTKLVRDRDGLLYLLPHYQLVAGSSRMAWALYCIQGPDVQHLSVTKSHIRETSMSVDPLSLLDTIVGSDGFIYGMLVRHYSHEGSEFFRLGTSSQFFATLDQELASARRTIEEMVSEVESLQAQISDLADQVVDLTSENAALETQIDQLNINLALKLNALQTDFRRLFRDPDFTIPGTTNISELEILMRAILNLTKGHKNAIYKELSEE